MPLIKNKSEIEETVSIYESLRQSYIENGYREYIFVKNDRLTDFLSVVYGLPFAALYTVIYSLVHRTIPDFGFYIFIISVILLYITTPVHEATRAYLQFLIDLTIFLFLLIALQPIYCSALLPLLIISNSILIGHFFVLTNSKSSNVFFIISLVGLILLFAFNIWTLL